MLKDLNDLPTCKQTTQVYPSNKAQCPFILPLLRAFLSYIALILFHELEIACERLFWSLK